jgi:membrane fusion protein, multidrug efflux system
MASAFLKPSKIIAIVLVGASVVWIASGVFESNEEPATEAAAPTSAIPIQKVSVASTVPEKHERNILVSCVTEADRRATAVARSDGIIIKLMAVPGAAIRAGQTTAIISDEGREAAVKQAEALVAQRKAEFDANKRLIDQGTTPRNTLPALEAALAAADASLAVARAEADKQTIKSPIDGIIDSVPVQVGQAVRDGTQIAVVIDPDPMLAVGAVSEFRRASLKIGQNVTVRFVDGSPAKGTINFVSLSAEPATRTYKVETRMGNPDAAIADGLTCEMSISLAPIKAASVPRSALVFSDEGELGVRIVDTESKARFVPIEIVDDGRSRVWVSGIEGSTSVIVVGQDFVKNGDPVEAVSAAEPDVTTEPPA